MKLFLLSAILLTSLVSSAQYYYKDIIGTKESSALVSGYKHNNVRRVVVNSYDGENTHLDNLQVEQDFNPTTLALTTVSKSETNNESFLVTYMDASGKVIKTVDSSALVVSRTIYNYSPEGQLTSLRISSVDSSRKSNETEEHIWQYKDNKIIRMLRIKNKVDTTYVDFKLDENGNIIEEQETYHGKKSFAFLYYYDNNNRLTDIVRYNPQAKRLLPEYMFEYSPSNQVIQRITIPANSSEYIIWRYQFNDKGLKTKEAIYNKQKQLTGKIEYQYLN